jgi:hypothetical protein
MDVPGWHGCGFRVAARQRIAERFKEELIDTAAGTI